MDTAKKIDYDIIVAYDLEHGIGRDGKIPWNISSDKKFFHKITTQSKGAGNKNCVVMGKKTWFSIPKAVRPLSSRYNLVLSESFPYKDGSDFEYTEDGAHYCRSFETVNKLIAEFNTTTVFFIGGYDIYKEAFRRYEIRKVYVTQILDKFECDTFFPESYLANYEITECKTEYHEKVHLRFQTYKRRFSHHTSENAYLNLLKSIVEYGQYEDERTGVGSLALFEGNKLFFNLREGFPLLTTKRVFFRGVAQELFMFLSGKTDNKILQDKKVKIWEGNSSREYLDKIGQPHRQEGDLGKFYGFQWRHWGADYTDFNADYTGKGFDQIENIIHLIKTCPTSRRIILTAWNPADLNEVCLPPCHIMYQFHVNLEYGELSCHMYQRSADMFLGVPFNIASTALLTSILAKTCGLTPGRIIMTYGNAHVYLNHIQQVKEQIEREPYPFPTLTIKTKRDKLEDYIYEDLELNDYKHHPELKASMAV